MSATVADGEIISSFRKFVETDVAVPVAAMNSLVLLIEKSRSSTWMELEQELSGAINSLKCCGLEDLGGRTNISLGSGCDLFMKYVTRAFNLEYMEFSSCKAELLRRGQMFANMSQSSRLHIAEIGHSFVQDGSTVLVHGNSRVVAALLLKAAESKQFNVMITEGRPLAETVDLIKVFREAGIPTSMVLDCAVGAVMDEVDLCLVGAEGVMENGGIINKLGTYQIAMVAKALKKPFYVAVESYKFARMYPLTQRDIRDMCLSATYNCNTHSNTLKNNDQNIHKLDNPDLHRIRSPSLAHLRSSNATFDHLNVTIDFTPAEYITLLFTDLGVLTSAAVSDELIRLYQ
mmetsp:Transcript_35873/g.33973  ORF Transcript_35873/g.33973 Transcript_35873/m.33973 type:complete len:346 (-) Transcript_35873:87-1124(-)